MLLFALKQTKKLSKSIKLFSKKFKNLIGHYNSGQFLKQHLKKLNTSSENYRDYGCPATKISNYTNVINKRLI